MMIPQVVTVSCLNGADRSRFDVHVMALERLTQQFDSVGCLLSGYTQAERAKIKTLGVKVKAWDEPAFKYVKQNWLLSKLYRTTQTICLLDDDVAFDNDDAVSTVHEYLKKPPAPCVFPLPLDIPLGHYMTQQKRADLVQAPLISAGWMILVSHQLGVYYDGALKTSNGQMFEDMVFRCQCAAQGQQVLLSTLIQMRSLSKQSASMYAKDVKARNEMLTEQKQIVANRWPYMLSIDSPVTRRLRPIWHSKHKRLLTAKGLMRKTEYGYEINPNADERLRALYPNPIEIPLTKTTKRDWLGSVDATASSRINHGIADGLDITQIAEREHLTEQRITSHYKWLVNKQKVDWLGDDKRRVKLKPEFERTP